MTIYTHWNKVPTDPKVWPWQATWTAYVGVIPLGPVSRKITIFGNGGRS